jgi:hypothetical protein
MSGMSARLVASIAPSARAVVPVQSKLTIEFTLEVARERSRRMQGQ